MTEPGLRAAIVYQLIEEEFSPFRR